MNLASRTTVVVLVRQDDVPEASSKQKNDAEHFVRKFTSLLKKDIEKDHTYTFDDSFFLLGRSSLALILQCEEFSNVPELIQRVLENHRNFRKMENDNGQRMGAFEAYYFPAIQAMPLSRNPRNPIPALLFVRTPQNLEKCIQWIQNTSGVAQNVEALYLGLGIYDLMIQAGFCNLYDLRSFYCRLRGGLLPFWETSTLIGIPRQGHRSAEKNLTKHLEKISFSTSVKCARGLDAVVMPEVEALFRRKLPSMIPTYGRHRMASITNLRQGYMDLEAHYCCRTIAEAFHVTCAIRKIEGVVDTCTVVQLPLEEKSVSGGSL